MESFLSEQGCTKLNFPQDYWLSPAVGGSETLRHHSPQVLNHWDSQKTLPNWHSKSRQFGSAQCSTPPSPLPSCSHDTVQKGRGSVSKWAPGLHTPSRDDGGPAQTFSMLGHGSPCSETPILVQVSGEPEKSHHTKHWAIKEKCKIRYYFVPIRLTKIKIAAKCQRGQWRRRASPASEWEHEQVGAVWKASW